MSSFLEMTNKYIKITTKYNVEIIDKATYDHSFIEEGDIFKLVLNSNIAGQKILYFDTYEEARKAQLKIDIAHAEVLILDSLQKRNVNPKTENRAVIAVLVLTVILAIANALFLYYVYGV